MAEHMSDPDISDSPTDEDDDEEEEEEEDEEGEGEADAAQDDADEDEDEEEEEGSIAGRRFPQRQHPYPRYHLHPQQHHLMQFQQQQHHHHQHQQQHHQQQLGEKNAVQQPKLGRTLGRDYSQRKVVDVDDDDEDEEDDRVDEDDDEEDDDVDEEDGVGEEDDDDADVDIDEREEREEGRAEEEDDEDFESPEKPQHLKDYDPAEPLALEDLMMEKDELAATHDGDEEGNDDNASRSPSGAGACPESGAAAVGEEEHGPPTTSAEPEHEPDHEHGILDFMKRPSEMDEGTPEEQANFVKELERFFIDRKMEYRPPKFYRENLNCLKLWRTVIRLGGYDTVTSRKLWRQVGDTFKPPKSCTTVSWSFRGFYEKALLDYERFKLHGICPNTGQGDGQYEGGASSNPNTSQPGYMPNLGRARRDAASRAMQGWHSQRYFGSEVADPVIKERSSNSASKRAKQLKMGHLKRKKTTSLERDVQAARGKGTTRVPYLTNSKIKDDSWEEVGNQSFFNMQRKKGKQDHTKQEWGSNLSSDVWVTDEGPQADWVKINVHKTNDCFEVYALVPGLVREEVRVQCEPGGQLMIVGDPEQPDNPWGVTSFKKVINLASPIDASQTSAVFTLRGQLFIRVPFSQLHA